MFGYIECAKDELKVKELVQYRSYYCGVCHSLRSISTFGGFVLANDAVFYALLTDVFEKSDSAETKCCIRPKKHLCAAGEYIDRAALINILLFINKINDDFNDKQYYKKILKIPFLSAYKKICQQADFAVEICNRKLNTLNNLEKSGCDSVDECADVFAQMCAELCCPDFVLDEASRLIYHIGYYVAKWVYIIDALDDFKSDMDKGLYNPILQAFKCGKILRGDIFNFVKNKLDECLCQSELAVALLPENKNTAIIENIVCYGLKNVTNRVLNGVSRECFKL